MSARQFIYDKVVYLGDTNAEGNVYFARHFDWQGEAREEFYRQNFPLEVWKSGLKLVTINASIEYKKELFLYDELRVEIKIANLQRMSLELIFESTEKSTGELIASGIQKIAFKSSEGKLIPIPEQIKIVAENFLK